MTLHDEFEQNVKTLVGILDDGIKTTDKWFEDFKKVNEHNLRFLPKRTTDDVISIVESFYPFRDLFPEILRFLTHHIPNFKDKVESGYSDIKKKTEEIVGKCSYAPLGPPANPVIPYAEMCGLKSSIEQLASDLRFCAKSARKEKWYQNRTLQAAFITILVIIASWFLAPYINNRMKPPVDNPTIQSPRMPQAPHKSNVRPTQISEPAKLKKPQLIGIPDLVNEPNKTGRDTND